MEKFGLLGKKLTHSLSPFIHEKLFSLQGKNAVYELIECEDFDDFAAVENDYAGYNVTIPYKENIFAVVRADGGAKQYGAVNCVDNAKKIGYNTDAYGFAKSVEGIYKSDYGNILLIGFGGVAKVIARKYQNADLTIAVRNCNKEKVKTIKDFLSSESVKVADIGNIGTNTFDLAVNATPVGMYPNVGATPIPTNVIKRCGAVYDTVYNPLETELLRIAKACGIPCKCGLDMLVEQAVKSHWHWYGAEFKRQDIDNIIKECYKKLRSEQ